MLAQLLERDEIRSRMRPITVEQYHILAETGAVVENVELVEGAIIEKMSKSPAHVTVTARLKKALDRALLAAFHVRQESPLTLAGSDSEPEPDLAVVAGDEEQYAERHPQIAALVIEVAQTSLTLDREKVRIYALAGIPEYWIVNLNENVVEVYREPRGDAYASMKAFRPDEPIDIRSFAETQMLPNEFLPGSAGSGTAERK